MFSENKGEVPPPAITQEPDTPLSPSLIASLRGRLPVVAERTVAAIRSEVPGYTGSLSDEMATTIEHAVERALAAFLNLVTRSLAVGTHEPLDAARREAYRLGRGEARAGRSMDALLAAYRVGARVAWQEMAGTAVDSGASAPTVARFAELTFAYIDALSASSVAGHADELASSARLREQQREQLARALVRGAPLEDLVARAEQAGWPPPETLTVVLVPSALAGDVRAGLDPRTLVLPDDALELGTPDLWDVLLIPDAGRQRATLLRALASRPAIVAPAWPWSRAADGFRLAARALLRIGPPTDGPLDTLEHLPSLVVGADLVALQELHTRALAPFDTLPDDTAQRLGHTLRSWLLHLGRRRDVAADLHVHPQTVRYRMNQIRELMGDRLDDPRLVEELIIALCLAPSELAAQ